jgi:hypothetical protein
MIYFFTPYSTNHKLLEAYDHYMTLLPNDNDWACFMDGDIMFLRSDFGHIIKEYTEKYPDTGIFTCYASRCFYPAQVPNEVDQKNDSIKYHRKVCEMHHTYHHLAVKKINRQIAGHLMVINKKIWQTIREKVFSRAAHETIEGVDTAISRAVLELQLDILLMKGLYVMHYFRLVEGISHKKHLGYGIKLHIVTPCCRPENLKTISESINIPRASYKWWVVMDADPKDVPAEMIPENANLLFHRDPKSIAGHAQRNFALTHINDGYVYFLDDDTTLHPELYQSIAMLPEQNDFIHFDQAHPDGTKRIGGTVEVNHIDTGSAVASRELIGFNRFRHDLYNADGFFWKAVSRNAQRPKYIQKMLSIYNLLAVSH